MKILSIRGRNIASLEGDFAIDFTTEPLLSAGIFAITGSTGSGKSSILDTLCLALYAQIPRNNIAKEYEVKIQDSIDNRISINDVRTILRKGSSDGFAEVIFKGQDNSIYKADWTVRRARGKIDGSLQNFIVTLTNLSTKTLFGGTRTEILAETVRLTGLTFEQFTRSVLLAQGEFAAFLKADKSAKAELLEKLTGTEIYSEISIKVYEKYVDAREALDDLKKQLDGISILSADEVENLKTKLAENVKFLKNLFQQKEQIKSDTDWFLRFSEIHKAIADAEQELIRAKAVKDESKARLEHLVEVENVQESKPLMDSKQTAMSMLTSKMKEAKDLQEIIDINYIKYLEFEKSLKQTEALLKSKEQEFELIKPEIEKAKRLDVLLETKLPNITEAEDVMQIAINKSTDLEIAINNNTEILYAVSEEIKKLNEWFKVNEYRKEIATQEVLVLSKLRDAELLLIKQKNLTNDLDTESRKNQKISEELILQKELYRDIDEKMSDISEIIAERTLVLSQYNRIQLEHNEFHLADKMKEITLIKEIWEGYIEAEALYAKGEELLKENKTVIETVACELDNKRNSLNLISGKKEASEKALASAILRSTENINRLRQELKAGEECPVCGSKEHLYTRHDNFSFLLEDLKNETKENNIEYEELLKKVSKLEQQLKSNLLEKNKYISEIELLASKLKLASEAWNDKIKDNAILKLTPTKRIEWIKNEKDRIANATDIVKSKLREYNLERDNISKHNEDLKLEKAKAEDINRFIIQYEQELALSDQSLKKIKQELIEINDNVKGIFKEMNPLFYQADWSEKWKYDPQMFSEKIKIFSKDWKDNTELLEYNRNQFDLLNAEIQAVQKYFSEHKIVLDAAKERLNSLNSDYNTIKLERKSIFEGKSALEKEGLYESAITRLLEELKISQSSFDKKKEELNIFVGRLSQVKNDILTQEINHSNALKRLTDWLITYNSRFNTILEEERLQYLLSYSIEWISSERLALKEFEDAILKSDSTLKERISQYHSHISNKASERTQEELIELDTMINSEIERTEKEKMELSFKINQDNENKKRSSKTINEIAIKNGIFEQWAKLYDIIGSADGKKFRQFAQENTLEVLLLYANNYLYDLAPRYKLECIPNSLSLQVIDFDMGNEIRSIHSLSGGESFLVSLALALGLASLSSNQMMVESLFIDEGFGSLDPITLTIAMDALEKLQYQGRKVGVISHIQELTERINTQIQVIKIGNGRSRVEVKG